MLNINTIQFVGAAYKIISVDKKKQAASDKAAFAFRTSKLSLSGVPDETLSEIQKFPLPVQQLIGDETLAVTRRLEKGKPSPGLETAACYCRFFTRYLVPCRHIFHEDWYEVNKLLTEEKWTAFQRMFAESGFEIYQSRERVEVLAAEEIDHEAHQHQGRFNELLERLRDRYWRESLLTVWPLGLKTCSCSPEIKYLMLMYEPHSER